MSPLPCPARQIAERHAGDLADAHRAAAAAEAELEGKAREGGALLAESLELKVRAHAARKMSRGRRM